MTDNKTYDASAIALNDDDLGGVTGGYTVRTYDPDPIQTLLKKQSGECQCTCEHCGKEQHTESTPDPTTFPLTPPSYSLQGTNPIPATQQFPFPGRK